MVMLPGWWGRLVEGTMAGHANWREAQKDKEMTVSDEERVK